MARLSWASRVDWRDVGKNVLVGAANAVGAILVYGLAIFIVIRVLAGKAGSDAQPTSALSRAVTVRTGGLVNYGAPLQDQGQ